jgi:hypothetical protein
MKKKKKVSNVILPAGEIAEKYRQKRNFVAKFNFNRGYAHKSGKDYSRKNLRRKLKKYLKLWRDG